MNADEVTGELVHIEMRRRRMSQVELGEALGISQAAAGRKLYGARSWTLDEVIATANLLGVPVASLLPGDDYTPVLTGRGRAQSAGIPASAAMSRPESGEATDQKVRGSSPFGRTLC